MTARAGWGEERGRGTGGGGVKQQGKKKRCGRSHVKRGQRLRREVRRRREGVLPCLAAASVTEEPVNVRSTIKGRLANAENQTR